MLFVKILFRRILTSKLNLSNGLCHCRQKTVLKLSLSLMRIKTKRRRGKWNKSWQKICAKFLQLLVFHVTDFMCQTIGSENEQKKIAHVYFLVSLLGVKNCIKQLVPSLSYRRRVDTFFFVFVHSLCTRDNDDAWRESNGKAKSILKYNLYDIQTQRQRVRATKTRFTQLEHDFNERKIRERDEKNTLQKSTKERN